MDNGLYLIHFVTYDRNDNEVDKYALTCAPSPGVAVDRVIADYEGVYSIDVSVWIAPDELGSIDYILLPNDLNLIRDIKKENDY